MSFRITGLPAERFAHLFALSDEQLAAQGAVRRIADGRVPGYPCRVSLRDAREGDELILVNYEHHGVNSPYRMRFAIYVREDETTYDAIDEVPAQLRTRTLAVRAFDHDAMMVGCEMVDGRELAAAIGRLFANAKAAYLLRAAMPPRSSGPERTPKSTGRMLGSGSLASRVAAVASLGAGPREHVSACALPPARSRPVDCPLSERRIRSNAGIGGRGW